MGGINIPLASADTLAGIGELRSYASSTDQDDAVASDVFSPFRPPQWAKPALVMLTIPPPYVQNSGNKALSSSTDTPNGAEVPDSNVITVSVKTVVTPPNAAPSYLVFDGVMRSRPSQRARPTKMPIQVGANISDHVILDPAVLSMEIVMTDVLPAYAPDQWVGNPSKSISCFQILDNLRLNAIPLTVTTRLKTYNNMIIADIIPDETVKTLHGLRAQVEFEQIFVAQVSTQTYSARPQTTGDTAIGTTPTSPPSDGVVAQNGLPSTSTGVPSSEALQAQYGKVPGASNWSSNNTSQLTTDFDPVPAPPGGI